MIGFEFGARGRLGWALAERAAHPGVVCCSPLPLHALVVCRVASLRNVLPPAEYARRLAHSARPPAPACSNAEFHPLIYLDGLARAVERLGGRIFEGTKVMEANGGGAGVVTQGGARVRCDHVVLATNSPINLNLAVHSRQSPYRTYVVGLVIPRDRYRLAEYWSTEEPYHYIRAEDWDEQNYLLIVGKSALRGTAEKNSTTSTNSMYRWPGARTSKGMLTFLFLWPSLDDHRPRAAGGEDHFTGVQPSSDPYVALENYARQRWPACREVALRWNGQVSHDPCLCSCIPLANPVFFCCLFARGAREVAPANIFLRPAQVFPTWRALLRGVIC